MDTNSDSYLTEGDNIDSEHLALINEYCDEDGNGIIDPCEIHSCVNDIENEWRAEYCSPSDPVYCTCFIDYPECPDAWSCT